MLASVLFTLVFVCAGLTLAKPRIPSSYEANIQLKVVFSSNLTFPIYNAHLYRDNEINKSFVVVSEDQQAKTHAFYCDLAKDNAYVHDTSANTCNQLCSEGHPCKSSGGGRGSCGCVLVDLFGFFYASVPTSSPCLSLPASAQQGIQSYIWEDNKDGKYIRFCFDDETPLAIESYSPKDGKSMVQFLGWKSMPLDASIFAPPVPCPCTVKRVASRDEHVEDITSFQNIMRKFF